MPDYKQIYTDILNKKFPEKKEECKNFLKKANLSAIEIIELNKKLFGINKETEKFNQRHRSYSRSDILNILDYQKKYQLNNTEPWVEFHQTVAALSCYPFAILLGLQRARHP